MKSSRMLGILLLMLMVLFLFGCGKGSSGGEGLPINTAPTDTTAAPPDSIPTTTTIVPSDTPSSAPTAPTGLTGGSSQSKIALSWEEYPETLFYNVYRDGVFLASVSTAFFVDDEGLAPSTKYCYAVTVVDVSFKESIQSDLVCITTLEPLMDITIPIVLSTSPVDHAVEVETDPLTISAIFSEPMNTLSVIGIGKFSVEGVVGTTSYDDFTFKATFTPSVGLLSGTTYTATISGNVQDVAGNKMGADFIWSFVTAITPSVTLPSVVLVSPIDGAINVDVNSMIIMQFSEAINSDTLLNTTNFVISPNVVGLLTYNQNNLMAMFKPSVALTNGTTYSCKISKNVTDLAGHKMAADHTWSFVTTP